MTRLAIIAGALCLPAIASAYDFHGAKWDVQGAHSGAVNYVISNELDVDLRDQSNLEVIQLGHAVWTALPCSFMAWEYTGRTENTAWGASDGENVNSWRNDSWDDSASALGIAVWSAAVGGFIADCDIKFNGVNHRWGAYSDGDVPNMGVDVAGVAAHETGHCLGLGHTDVPGSTMWPSDDGSLNGRSLGADDILGACEIYPSGGAIPDPGDPPPPIGDLGFGEDCSSAGCTTGLFCVNDGTESYCSESCVPNEEGDAACGAGFYCARLSGGTGSCAKGQPPLRELSGFGENCGTDVLCEAGLNCVNDEEQLYCTGPCVDSTCPGGFFCADLEGGRDVCARDSGSGGPAPGQGEACSDDGLCSRGFFCLNDPLNVDAETGDAVPYCTNSCDEGACADGYRCEALPTGGDACRMIPNAGERAVGDECWSNPEKPWEPPTCGDGLFCWNFEMDATTREVTNLGVCTKNCTADDCCPSGWGCQPVTPAFAQCLPEQSDHADWVCTGVIPTNDAGVGGAGDDEPAADGGGGGGGCSATQTGGPVGLGLLLLAAGALGLRRRRR